MMILQDAISRANKITSKSYLLLRLWVLHKYHNDIIVPEITTDTISMAMKFKPDLALTNSMISWKDAAG